MDSFLNIDQDRLLSHYQKAIKQFFSAKQEKDRVRLFPDTIAQRRYTTWRLNENTGARIYDEHVALKIGPHPAIEAANARLEKAEKELSQLQTFAKKWNVRLPPAAEADTPGESCISAVSALFQELNLELDERVICDISPLVNAAHAAGLRGEPLKKALLHTSLSLAHRFKVSL